MRSEDLLRSIGNVDDKYIDELRNDKTVPMRRRNTVYNKLITVAACLAVLILCASVLAGIGQDIDIELIHLDGTVTAVGMVQNSVVTVDVNPSLSFEVDDRGTVVSVNASNAEGEGIVGELSIVGLPYTDAVRQIVAKLQEDEYLTELKNSLLVSVRNADESLAESLRYAVVTAIGAIGEETGCELSILSQVITDAGIYAQLAMDHGISLGRAALIEKTCDSHEIFSFDQLAENSIQTINQLFEYIDLPSMLYRLGAAAATVAEESLAKLGIEELSGQELIDFTRSVADFYDRVSPYSDEAAVARTVSCVIEAVCSRNSPIEKPYRLVQKLLSNESIDCADVISAGEDVVEFLLKSEDFWRMIEKIG